MASVGSIQSKFLACLEKKLPAGKAMSPTLLKKSLNHFDVDQDGWLSCSQFMQCADGKLEADEAEYLFMFWDTRGGQQEPSGMVEIDFAMSNLIESLPQYDTLLKGGDPDKVAVRGQNNRPSQVGGIFGGGCYAAESERENTRNRPPMPPPAKPYEAAPFEPPPLEFKRPVQNASSIDGGIFGQGAAESVPPPSRSNRSNQSSVPGGIFGYEQSQPVARARGRDSNASSIPGGIFG